MKKTLQDVKTNNQNEKYDRKQNIQNQIAQGKKQLTAQQIMKCYKVLMSHPMECDMFFSEDLYYIITKNMISQDIQLLDYLIETQRKNVELSHAMRCDLIMDCFEVELNIRGDLSLSYGGGLDLVLCPEDIRVLQEILNHYGQYLKN